MLRDAWTPDRRRGDRRLVPFPLHAQLEGPGDPMRVRELGPGGMVVEAGRPVPAGARVRFTLGSGADAIGPMEGHVAHSRLILPQRQGEIPIYLTGVAFARVAADHAVRVAAWLVAIDQHGQAPSPRVP